MRNSTTQDYDWQLERVQPVIQNWEEGHIAMASNFNPLGGYMYAMSQMPEAWMTPQSIVVPFEDSATYGFSFEPLQNGCDVYTYYLAESNTRVDSFNIELCKTVGLNENEIADISVYPNPSNTDLNISFQNQVPSEVFILDVLGNEIAGLEGTDVITFYTENLSNGMYYVSWSMDRLQRRKKFQVFRTK